MHCFWTICCCCFLSLYCRGQILDSLLIEEVVIVDSVLNFSNNDLQLQSSGLIASLNDQTSIYVREYGSGGLGSISVRGGNAQQSQIQWKGINLNNPLHGQSDLSLIPRFFLNSAQIENINLKNGSGALGGVLSIDSSPAHLKQTTLDSQIYLDAFKNLEIGNAFRFVKNKLSSESKLFWGIAQNDFEYTHEGQTYPTTHNQNNQQQFLQEFRYQVNNKAHLNGSFWLYRFYRQIPPIAAITNNFNKDTQLDKGLRSVAQYVYLGSKMKWDWQTVFTKEYIAFNDDASTFSNFQNRLAWKYYILPQLQCSVQVTQKREQTNSLFLEENKERNTWAIWNQIGIKAIQNLSIDLSLLKEFISTYPNTPWLPSVSASYQMGKIHKWQISYSIARNYRIPTFNDLYWVNLGNKDLRAEEGLLQNISSKLQSKITSRINIQLGTALFYNRINDYIQWQINSENQWTPQNVKDVLNKGAEANFLFNYKKNIWQYQNGLNYALTDSKNLTQLNPFDQSKNKQLIYVPLHKVVWTQSLLYKQWKLIYTAAYTSKRYTTADNKNNLPAYWLHHLELGKKIDWNKHHFDLLFGIHNLLGKSYQTVALRPMPERNFYLSLRYVFKKDDE